MPAASRPPPAAADCQANGSRQRFAGSQSQRQGANHDQNESPALAIVFATASAHAQTFSAEDLARRSIERRAVEAVNWGMSAVNYDLMLQEMLNKTEGKVNQVVYWSRPLDWHNQTLTPNPDAIYFMAFFNTKDAGPIVVEVPPEGGERLAQRQLRRRLADAARGCRPVWERQGRWRQIPDPAARIQQRCSRELYRTSARYVRQLCAATLEPGEPQRRRCRKIGRLWQAGQGLPALAGSQSADDQVHRRCGRGVRFHHPLRRKLLCLARPHRAERAVAAARPGNDRCAELDRHREGQGL